MVTPKISVIVPAYNQPALLRETLLSLQKQTFQNFLVHVFDDCSPQPVFQALPPELLADKRFVYYKNKINKGANETIRCALSLADSDYVMVLHHDDLLHECFLDETYNFLEHEREVPFVYTLCNVLKDGELTGDFPSSIRPNLPTGVYDLALSFAINCWTVFSCVLIRTKFLRSIGNFESLLDRFDGMSRKFRNKGESDLYIFCRLASLGPVGVINKRLCYYRDHPFSNTHNELSNKSHIQNNIRTYDMIFGDLDFFPPTTRLMAKINSTARLVTHESIVRTVILSLRNGTCLNNEFSEVRDLFITSLGPQLRSFILDSAKLGFPRQFPDSHIHYMYTHFNIPENY